MISHVFYSVSGYQEKTPRQNPYHIEEDQVQTIAVHKCLAWLENSSLCAWRLSCTRPPVNSIKPLPTQAGSLRFRSGCARDSHSPCCETHDLA
jgi:hypothetical protein